MTAGKKYPEQVYIEEEKNEKYMEGNYDGDADQQYKQERADKRRSIQMEEDIRASQEAVYEKETERLSYEQKAVGEAFTKIMKEYVEDNIYQQYLVDGAVLRCNQAMTDDVVFTEWGEKVILEHKADEVCNIILNVPENPVYEDDDSENSMMINGLRYATVKDTIKNINIIVPKCNCRLAADRDEEEKRIRNDTDRNKNGVCMHLMRLNEEWDNFEVKDKEGFRIKYAKRVNVAPSPFSAGAGRMLDGSEDVVEEEVEGITMTSVLFCKHGGLIMPVKSGQTDDELLVILSKNREELTNEELKILGADFQKADENERTKIFKYLFFPPLSLEGESYAEKILNGHILILNTDKNKVPHTAERYINALNTLGINENNYKVEDMIGLFSWNQEKINQTYDECLKHSVETGILISPKLALAIIGAEGTGSYDTNSEVASCYNNGNGPQHDFPVDTELALNLLTNKLAGFIVYKDDYISASSINGGKERHLITYLCERTPILGKNQTGVYAESSLWIDVVEEKYQKYSKNAEDDERDYVKDYETFLEGYDKDIIEIKDSIQYEFINENGKVVAKEK